MKARLPQGFGGGQTNNLQQIAKQAQKMQEQMDETTKALEETEYSATSGGGAVSVTVTGKMEIKNLTISPEVVDPEDVEMLADLVIAAANQALKAAGEDKEDKMGQISGGLNLPGLF
ncbi:MAG: YbaB/EbfC family nucleoid-associated protein [Bacillota bacterium]|nr:YbaB/EbfC family nucleoid-associated protein [Bacillota bacterium]